MLDAEDLVYCSHLQPLLPGTLQGSELEADQDERALEPAAGRVPLN